MSTVPASFRRPDSLAGMRYLVRERIFASKDDFWVTDAMEIEHDGARVATVHKAVFSPLHHRSIIDLEGGGRLEAVGDFVDKNFEIRDGGQVLAQGSRAWFRIRDHSGADVAPGQNDALMIAIAICLDRIHAAEEEQRDRR